jgi:hypothetical protein
MENQKKNMEFDISPGFEVERRSVCFRDCVMAYWRKRNVR